MSEEERVQKGRRGFIGIGARPAVISGQAVVVGHNRL